MSSEFATRQTSWLHALRHPQETIVIIQRMMLPPYLILKFCVSIYRDTFAAIDTGKPEATQRRAATAPLSYVQCVRYSLALVYCQ